MESLASLDVHPPRAELVVKGEFDQRGSMDLRGRLEDAMHAGCFFFDVDASGVTCVDTAALGTLVWLHNTVVPLGGHVVVSTASQTFVWSATAAGLGDAFSLDLLPPEDLEPSQLQWRTTA